MPSSGKSACLKPSANVSKPAAKPTRFLQPSDSARLWPGKTGLRSFCSSSRRYPVMNLLISRNTTCINRIFHRSPRPTSSSMRRSGKAIENLASMLQKACWHEGRPRRFGSPNFAPKPFGTAPLRGEVSGLHADHYHAVRFNSGHETALEGSKILPDPEIADLGMDVWRQADLLPGDRYRRLRHRNYFLSRNSILNQPRKSVQNSCRSLRWILRL